MKYRGHFSNRTHWNTEQVKALVYKIGADEGFSLAKMRKLKYEIGYHGAGDFGCLGKATLGDSLKNHGLWMRLILPKSGEIDIVRFAMTIAHEWGHVKGLEHVDMIDKPRYFYRSSDKTNWNKVPLENYEAACEAADNKEDDYEARCREHYAWAKEWTIEPMVLNCPSPEELKQKNRAKKLAQAQKMVKQTATRIKRLQTALKKWERRVRLYSK